MTPHLCGGVIRWGEWTIPCTHRDAAGARRCKERRENTREG
jgi:hypothetical protein